MSDITGHPRDGFRKATSTTTIQEGKNCKCGCHDDPKFKNKETTYCRECQQNHMKIWLKNGKGKHSWLKRIDLCGYPDQKGDPCHLKIHHHGFHATRDGHYSESGDLFEHDLNITISHNDCLICAQKKDEDR